MLLENATDHAVMLLSTDWFRAHWDVIGLKADDEEKSKFQIVCRGIVSEMIGSDKSYFFVDFSEERLKKTAAQLEAAAAAWLKSENSLKLRNMAESYSLSVIYKDAYSAIQSTNNELSSGVRRRDLELKIVKTWTRCNFGFNQYRKICLSSMSNWDVSIRGLHDNQPDWLATFLIIVLRYSSITRFLDLLSGQCSKAEMKDIYEYYKEAWLAKFKRHLQLPPKWELLFHSGAK